jgi:hypothetical protein
MRELKVQLTELNEEVSSKSALGKAVTYTLNHWSGRTAFLGDGRIEVDTNVVERSTKSVALTELAVCRQCAVTRPSPSSHRLSTRANSIA